MTDQYHIYAHFTKDSGELFYIGCGDERRVNQKSKFPGVRNKTWHDIVDKHGFESEIIISFDNKEEAFAEELRLQTINQPRACLSYGQGKDKVFSKETRRKMSESSKGKTHSFGTRKKISEALKGRFFSEETKKKLSELNKGNTNWLGKKHTIETRKKMSKKLIGNTRGLGSKRTLEHRKKISEFHSKPVINCRGEIFHSLKEAVIHFNLKDVSSIGKCISTPPRNKSAGRYPDGTKIKWKLFKKDN